MTVKYVAMIKEGAASPFNPREITHVWTDYLGDCIFAVAILGSKGAAIHYASKHPSGSGAMKRAFGTESRIKADAGMVLTNDYFGRPDGRPSDHEKRINTIESALGLTAILTGEKGNDTFVYRLRDNAVFKVKNGLDPHKDYTASDMDKMIADGSDVTDAGSYTDQLMRMKSSKKWWQFWKRG